MPWRPTKGRRSGGGMGSIKTSIRNCSMQGALGVVIRDSNLSFTVAKDSNLVDAPPEMIVPVFSKELCGVDDY